MSGISKDEVLLKNLFSPHFLLNAWQEKLSYLVAEGGKLALENLALVYLGDILNLLSGQRPQSSSFRTKIDFNLHTLEEVLFELRALKRLVFQNLNPLVSESLFESIETFFDSKIAQIATESAYQELSYKGWASLEVVEKKPTSDVNEMDFIKTMKERASIADAFSAEVKPSAFDSAHVLKERSNFLARASKTFSSAVGFQETVAKVASLSTDEFADWCIVDCFNESGEFRRVAVCHRRSQFQELTDELMRDYGPKLHPGSVPSEVIRSRKTLFVPQVTQAHYQATARSPRHEEILRGLGSQSYLCLPLVVRDNFLGALTLVSSTQTYTPEDVIFAEEFASRVAIAIENAIQYVRAQNAVSMRDNFMGMVAHDLKNPLQVIHMSSHLLLRESVGEDPARTRRHAATIQEASKRMSRLISDLLDLSRFDAGKFFIDAKPEKLSFILNELERCFTPLAEEHGVSLAFPESSSLVLSCDRDRLIQALSNLMSNAIKFTPEGGTIEVSYQQKDSRILIAVKDSGPGIKPEALTRIFERFWQANESDAKRGTGIGLSIVKMMAEAHGGSVYARSVDNEGSTFVLDLPLNQEMNQSIF